MMIVVLFGCRGNSTNSNTSDVKTDTALSSIDTVDKSSSVLAKKDTTIIIYFDSTKFTHRDSVTSYSKRSLSVYRMVWPATDFYNKFKNADTIGFLFFRSGVHYKVKGEVKKNPSSRVLVTLQKTGDPIVITSTQGANTGIWIRRSRLSHSEIAEFIKDLKDRDQIDLETSAKEYVIIIAPELGLQGRSQYVGLRLRALNKSGDLSLANRQTNPCPVCQ